MTEEIIMDLENPNSVNYEDEGGDIEKGSGRPVTGQSYAEWSKDNNKDEDAGPESLSPSLAMSEQTDSLSDEDTKILLEKEFDDYYEDRVHKSAGPVVFLCKCMGMLPVIWTEDEAEAECKSYFNMYTFVVFIGWIGLGVLTGTRIDGISSWPADLPTVNATQPNRFFTKMTMDTYAGSIFGSCLVAVIFGIFKSRLFAEVLFTAAEVDSQLQLKEKHYDKIKTKSLFWVFLEGVLLVLHAVGLFFFMEDVGRDLILYGSFLLANIAIGILDLEYIHLCMVLCKRYRRLNKIIGHIIKPFKTFRSEEPSNQMLQSILQYRWEAIQKEEARNTFDQIWEPSEKDAPSPVPVPDKPDFNQEIPLALCLKGGDKEISREEESTVILQLDILRGIHSDLHNVGQEINHLVGFQMLINLITNIVIVTMFGYYFATNLYDGTFYWPFLVLMLTPTLRILFIGHWAQVMIDTSMKPFWTMSQMSTLDGSPKLERQVQKFSLQASQKTARVTAAGYFYITRGTITKVFGLVFLLVFLMMKFDRLERVNMVTASSQPKAA